jgi:hypothetical protein
MYRRLVADSDLEWIRDQQREVVELREKQLQRDGRIYDPGLKRVIERDDDE